MAAGEKSQGRNRGKGAQLRRRLRRQQDGIDKWRLEERKARIMVAEAAAEQASRHAAMEEVQSTGTVDRRIAGIAPLRGLIGYSTALRSLSKGRGTFTLRPAGFRPSVPE